MMIKVFFEVFKNVPNPPGLILKTSSAGFSVIDREEIKKKIEYIRKDVKAKTYPKVWLLHGDLTDDEMNCLYNHPKVKAHEAWFSGKPIIAPCETGQKDFLDENNTVKLIGQYVKVPKSAFPKDFMVDTCEWFGVNNGLASQILRDVYKNYTKYAVKGKKLMLMNRKKFTHDKMRERLEQIIDQQLDTLPKQVDIKLPNMKTEDKPKEKGLPKLRKI